MTIFLFVVICTLVYASDPSAYSKLIPSPHRGMSVYAAFCQFFCEKRHDFGYATLVLVKNKLNSTYVSYIYLSSDNPTHPPPPPPHTHTPNFRERISKQIQRTSGARNIVGQTHFRGGGGGHLSPLCVRDLCVDDMGIS